MVSGATSRRSHGLSSTKLFMKAVTVAASGEHAEALQDRRTAARSHVQLMSPVSHAGHAYHLLSIARAQILQSAHIASGGRDLDAFGRRARHSAPRSANGRRNQAPPSRWDASRDTHRAGNFRYVANMAPCIRQRLDERPSILVNKPPWGPKTTKICESIR